MTEQQRTPLDRASEEVVADLCQLAEDHQGSDPELSERLWEAAHKLELALGGRVAR